MEQRDLENSVNEIRKKAQGIPSVSVDLSDGRRVSGGLTSCVCGNLTISPKGSLQEQVVHCSTIDILVEGE